MQVINFPFLLADTLYCWYQYMLYNNNNFWNNHNNDNNNNNIIIIHEQIEFERFVRHSSAGEMGTSRASMNRTEKTTASKGIGKTYNEYKEFHEREVEAHICAAFMEMSGMENMDCK